MGFLELRVNPFFVPVSSEGGISFLFPVLRDTGQGTIDSVLLGFMAAQLRDPGGPRLCKTEGAERPFVMW